MLLLQTLKKLHKYEDKSFFNSFCLFRTPQIARSACSAQFARFLIDYLLRENACQHPVEVLVLAWTPVVHRFHRVTARVSVVAVGLAQFLHRVVRFYSVSVLAPVARHEDYGETRHRYQDDKGCY